MPLQRDENWTTPGKANAFKTLMPLLESMFREFQEFSKKKQEGVVAIQKVKMVNRLLTSIYLILDGQPNREFLDLLDEDDLPQNSDVVLVLSQTVAAMNAFKAKYYGWDGAHHVWFTAEVDGNTPQ